MKFPVLVAKNIKSKIQNIQFCFRFSQSYLLKLREKERESTINDHRVSEGSSAIVLDLNLRENKTESYLKFALLCLFVARSSRAEMSRKEWKEEIRGACVARDRKGHIGH